MEDFIKDVLTPVAPKGVNLKVGDTVKWVNIYGVEWGHKVIGFADGEIYVDKESYWAPIKKEWIVEVVAC